MHAPARRASMMDSRRLSFAACVASVAAFSSMPPVKGPVRALLAVDVQTCFLQNSTTLPVDDSDRILPVLNSLRTETDDFFQVFIRSQDYHPKEHISFGPTHGLPGFYNSPFGIKMMCTQETSPDSCCPMLHPDYCPDANAGCPQESDATDPAVNKACEICFPDGPAARAVNPACKEIDQAMWPDHCRSPFEFGDGGFPSQLVPREDDVILRKGQAAFIDGYSVFQDNAKFGVGTGFEGGFDFNLHEYLTQRGVTEVYVAGLAYDFCVSWSAKDAAALGYEVFLIEDAAAGIFPESLVISEREAMLEAGVSMRDSAEYVTRSRRLDARDSELHAATQKRVLAEAGVSVINSKDIFNRK